MIRILQISDIHWQKRRKWEEDFAGMKSRFLDDMKEYRAEKGCIDYIFICGDIAFRGIKEEYDIAREYIIKICDRVGCQKKDVFVVPGNHDLNRKAPDSELRELTNAALAFGQRNNAFLDNVILQSKELRKISFNAFKDYNEFAKEYLCNEEIIDIILCEEEGITEETKLYYHERLSKKVGDFYVSIRGVNTALNCDSYDWNEENREGHLQMLPRRAYYLDKSEKQEIRIIMGHHPLDFLTSKNEIGIYLNNHYHIQLFGHVHTQNVEGDNYIRVLSGALNPPKDAKQPEKYKPVYNIIEITQTDNEHIKVKGEAQIWDKTAFVHYEDGCFEKIIRIERNVNKWKEDAKNKTEMDVRSVKFKFIGMDERTKYFDKIKGLNFTPAKQKSEYDNCIEFLKEVEKQGKLKELNKLIS